MYLQFQRYKSLVNGIKTHIFASTFLGYLLTDNICKDAQNFFFYFHIN